MDPFRLFLMYANIAIFQKEAFPQTMIFLLPSVTTGGKKSSTKIIGAVLSYTLFCCFLSPENDDKKLYPIKISTNLLRQFSSFKKH